MKAELRDRLADARRRARARNGAGRLGALLLAAALTLLWLPAAQAQTLRDISFVELPGERVQIQLQLSEPVDEPLSFAIDNPARIALDFPGVTLATDRRTQSIGVGMARSVTAVEAGGRTRVVLNLVALVPYELEARGSEVRLTLESAGGATARAFPEPASRPATPVGGESLENIDFRRGTAGEGRVIVTLSDADVVVDSRQEGGKLVVDFLNTALPERLERTLDVVDFATPVATIDTFPQGDGTRMVVTPATEGYEHLAYQSDNLFTLELKPLTPEEAEERQRERVGFTGERLSLNFQNIEVRAVLQLLADFTGLNLVASDTVTGNVTLRLKNVPWDQALDIILKARGLGMRQVGNVIMVAPIEEIAAREKLELESQQQIEELAPLRTEFVQVNYAKASELAALLKAKENSLLSERGNVSIDPRTNTLLVRDTAENLAGIRELVTRLDIPVRQVLIESRIVNATVDFTRDLGVRFGYGKTVNQPGAGGEEGEGTFFLGSNTNFDEQGFIVDLPATQGAPATLGLAVGKIGSWLLQLELSAAQAENRVEIISSPRVVTANQREALIESGQEIAFQEAASSGATSTSFKKAVLSLKVTPQITPDDRIIMDLEVSNDSPGEQTPAGPAINTDSVATQVLVDNGETVVLGGIYQDTERDTVNRVPFFSELPLVGNLFRQNFTQREQQELLVFITPRILKEALAVP
jgi:type IV pilus assembly protein PilQ